MGVVGAALRGFGRALSKKSGTIKSVKPAKNLTKRRKTHDEIRTTKLTIKFKIFFDFFEINEVIKST